MGLAEKFARIDADIAAEASFEGFWCLYPRKVAKLEAVKAWKQMTREFSAEEIIEGLRRNLPDLLRRDKQYVKHPASWLRAGCWMDEPALTQLNGRRTIVDAARDRIKEGLH